MLSLVPPGAVRLGLGCSRLGSVGGADADETRAVLHSALDHGVRVFDTSNIYGQGDSERLLGQSVRGVVDAVVISKAGKYVAWHRRLLLPAKAIIRASTRRSTNVKGRIADARAKPMPTRWDADFLTSSLDASLRRLGRERIDVFLLHSPTADVIRRGDAVSALDRARISGKIGVVGVSVDDPATARSCLDDDRIRALQVPLRAGTADYGDLLTRAAASGIAVIAREILGGPDGLSSSSDPANAARARISEVVRDPRISVPLIGATRVETLAASINAARGACRSDRRSVDSSAESDTSE